MEKARRYNSGKLRYELVSTIGLKELAKVYTNGAEKYTLRDEEGNILEDGSNNWRKGMSWMSVIASAQRHIEAWKEGEDLDELGTMHLANAAWNLFTILDYYKSYPQGDNRPSKLIPKPRIGLDIDDVLADFLPEWCKLWDCPIPDTWNFDRGMYDKFKQMKDHGTLETFFLGLPTKIKASELPFTPVGYVTARSIPIEITMEWLKINQFPQVPVYSVGFGGSKVEALKELRVDMFVDDNYNTFVELSKAGIGCYLFDTPHNKRHNVGYRRIYSLKELA